MYAAVPRITPCIVAAMLSVGELDGSLVCCVARERLRQTEVQNLDLAFRRHLHVGGLQVAVNDAFLVSGFQRLGDLLRKSPVLLRLEPRPSRLMRSASVSPDTNSITR